MQLTAAVITINRPTLAAALVDIESTYLVGSGATSDNPQSQLPVRAHTSTRAASLGQRQDDPAAFRCRRQPVDVQEEHG